MLHASEMWSGALPGPYCDYLVDRLSKYPERPATIGFADGFREEPAFRSSVIRWLDPFGADDDITGRIMQYVRNANRSVFGFDITSLNEIQFTEYHAEANGHYDWHQDVWLENPAPYDRKLSVSIQLSKPEDYDGGLLEFQNSPQPDASFLAQGSVIIFPSFLTHRVMPVTRGIRRSLVTWIEGSKWRCSGQLAR